MGHSKPQIRSKKPGPIVIESPKQEDLLIKEEEHLYGIGKVLPLQNRRRTLSVTTVVCEDSTISHSSDRSSGNGKHSYHS